MVAFSIADVFTPAGLAALGQVIAIDLMLAGDNVVILGTLAAGCDPAFRKRVLAIGVGAAMFFLVVFAWFATQLLDVVGLSFAGGLLLLWVAWKMWREVRAGPAGETAHASAGGAAPKSFARAAAQIALADLSMSLDNVLAVAGAARDHPTVLIFGLGLSVTLMAVAASFIARFIARHPWLAYVGLAVIVWVAGSMIWEGWTDPKIGVGALLHR